VLADSRDHQRGSCALRLRGVREGDGPFQSVTHLCQHNWVTVLAGDAISCLEGDVGGRAACDMAELRLVAAGAGFDLAGAESHCRGSGRPMAMMREKGTGRAIDDHSLF
jgi:hypothetical protein